MNASRLLGRPRLDDRCPLTVADDNVAIANGPTIRVIDYASRNIVAQREQASQFLTDKVLQGRTGVKVVNIEFSFKLGCGDDSPLSAPTCQSEGSPQVVIAGRTWLPRGWIGKLVIPGLDSCHLLSPTQSLQPKGLEGHVPLRRNRFLAPPPALGPPIGSWHHLRAAEATQQFAALTDRHRTAQALGRHEERNHDHQSCVTAKTG